MAEKKESSTNNEGNNSITIVENQSYLPPKVFIRNEVARATYEMSLNELRLMSCAIAKIKVTSTVDDWIYVTAKDMIEAGCPKSTVHNRMKDSIDALYNRSLLITEKIPNLGDSNREYRWLQAKHYFEGQATVGVKFGNDVYQLFRNVDKRFIVFTFEKLRSFSTAYAIRLFFIWESCKAIGYYRIRFSELKAMLGVSSNYERYPNFKARILEPAIEHCAKVGLFVTVSERRKNRTVDTLIFMISSSQQISNTPTLPLELEEEDQETLFLQSSQAANYAQKILTHPDKHRLYDELSALGFNLSGVTAVNHEIDLLTAWLRNGRNAFRAYPVLKQVGFKRRKRAKKNA